jgi:transposase
MTTLAEDLVPDELWALVEPLGPAPPRPPYGGRHRTISDRACLAAIVDLARTSTPWRLLPARELGCGSPATCWRRLTEWAQAGVFDQLHLEVLDRLGEQGRLGWEQASVATMSVRPTRGPRGAHIPSIVASLEASSSWSATAAGSPDRGGDRGQRQRHHQVPGRRRRHPADPDAGWAAADPTGQGSRRQGLGQPSQPGVSPPAWDQGADRSA